MKKLYAALLIALIGSHTIHGMDNSNSNAISALIAGGSIGILGLVSYLYTTKAPGYIADLSPYCYHTANTITGKLTQQDRTNCLNEYFANQKEMILNKQMRLNILRAKQQALEKLTESQIPVPSSTNSSSFNMPNKCPITDIFNHHGVPQLYQDCCTQEASKRQKLFRETKTLDQNIQTARTVNNALEEIHALKNTQIVHHTYEPDLKRSLHTISSQLSGAAKDLNTLKKAFSGSWYQDGPILSQLKKMNANLEKISKKASPGSSSV